MSTPIRNRSTTQASPEMTFRELHSPLIRKLHPSAKVLLSAIPGGRADLQTDLRDIQSAGIAFILCLVRSSELGTYGKTMASRSHETPTWCHCPTSPSCGAEAENALRHSLASLVEILRLGRTVLIHCQAGQIRTGCAAASLLVLLGASPGEAASAVETAGSFPFEDGPLPLFDAFCSSKILP
jgi:hypothetical protein